MTQAWTPELATGIEEIDSQHQELFQRLTRLQEGIVGGNRGEVAHLMAFLGEYVISHFGTEERWMIESDYPDYEAHKAEHDGFMQEFVRYSVELEQKGPTPLVGLRVNNWIAEWLKSHIMVADRALARYLAQSIH